MIKLSKRILILIALSTSAIIFKPQISFSQPVDSIGTPVSQPANSSKDDSTRRPKLSTHDLVGTDAKSGPYGGDTSTKEKHTLLCLNPLNLPKPAGLPPAVTTPGGALRDSWSGANLYVVPNVQGTKLTSKVVADGICNKYVQRKYGVSGARMAEFHDGDKSDRPGWSYWGTTSHLDREDANSLNDRLWVSINDQDANPWGMYGAQSNGQARNALTFVKLNQIQLR